MAAEQVRRWTLEGRIASSNFAYGDPLSPGEREPALSVSDLRREIADTRRQIEALMENAAAGTSHDLSYRVAVSAALTRFDYLAERLDLDGEGN